MKIAITLAAAASAAFIGLAGAAPAAAAPSTGAFGSQQKLTDGAVVTAWTIQKPTSSNDTVNVPVMGKLYEAQATVQAVQGASTPSIPFLNARTSDGTNYRVLWQAYAPEGLSGATLQQGSKASGKVYFDVTGAAPTSVVYNDLAQDRLVWGGSSSATPAAAPAAADDDAPGAAPASRSCGSDLFTGMPIPCQS